ncbi:septation protein A [Frischella sp. Ac48]|uniref:Inner membrane-spanning protein YciB n=1 Tax=Frischella japonica TaxID=2741544 RepID=A0ABR7QYY1_9GAMM|nr:MULTISPECIES: septation protein A [Frischella]MBC9131178.1 septation protein A [Frischella japonica]MBX4132158.1 septation protein A [Frischella sp. Ac48]
MRQFLNFIPLVFFFVFLVFYDIFAGVKALMISSTITLIITLIIYKKLEKMELFSYLMIIIFGGLTIYLDNKDFIKWKVTLINLGFAFTLLTSQFFFKKNLIQKLIGKDIKLDTLIWNKLNIIWSFFFIVCGIANLYVTYYMSDDFFGVFKAFILPGASLVITLISGIYIYKYLEPNDKK